MQQDNEPNHDPVEEVDMLLLDKLNLPIEDKLLCDVLMEKYPITLHDRFDRLTMFLINRKVI